MKTRKWDINEPCFIVDMSVSPSHISMGIMPAVITHIGGTKGKHVTATAFSTKQFGKQFIEGAPFASEKEAREWLVDYANRILAAAKSAPTSGMHPGWYIPEDAPRNGDTIYVIDAKDKEIIEAKVGILHLEGSRLEIGYDQSPGNPEASMVKAKQYRKTLAEAKALVSEQYGESFVFVSHTELAERTNAAINKIWADAEKRIKSPEFKKQTNELDRILNPDH